MMPMLTLSQYKKKHYRQQGEAPRGVVITLAGVSFVTMGATIRPLYYTEPGQKKPFFKQHHKAPPIVVGVGLTFVGLISLISEL